MPLRIDKYIYRHQTWTPMLDVQSVAVAARSVLVAGVAASAARQALIAEWARIVEPEEDRSLAVEIVVLAVQNGSLIAARAVGMALVKMSWSVEEVKTFASAFASAAVMRRRSSGWIALIDTSHRSQLVTERLRKSVRETFFVVVDG